MSLRLLLPLMVSLLGAAAEEARIPPRPATSAARWIDHAAQEGIPGTVRADRRVTLQARVPGVVRRIVATPGTVVAADALLVELDAQEVIAQRDQARALAVQSAADFARTQQLFADKVVNRADFDAAQARSAVAAATAAGAEVLVGYTRISAPFAGVIVRRHVEVGDLVAPGRPVIDLEDPASRRLEVEVPESLAGALAIGALLAVDIPAAGFAGPAPVVEITPAADPVNRSVLVKCALPGTAERLRSGQYGRAVVDLTRSKVLVVPTSALVRRGQLDAVQVVRDDRAHLRLVRLGGTIGDQTVIRAGLDAGEIVLTEGTADVADGQALGATRIPQKPAP